MVNMSPKEAFYECYNEKKRIPELEGIIVIDPEYSYRYACYIIKGRWEESERSIATDSQYSYLYAFYVLNGPFHLCHHIIFNSRWSDEYLNFLKSINYDLNEISEWLI